MLIVAKAPRPGLTKTRLEPLLGPEGCARLQAVLLARAGRWAAVAGGRTFVAFTPRDASGEVAALLPADAECFEQVEGHLGERIAAAWTEVARRHDGPVVLIGTDLPALAPHHLAATAADLADGVDVCLGPATDGGYYLLAAHAFHRALFEIEAEDWGGPRVMGLTLQAAHAEGLSLGLLTSERDLDTPADAAALLADPCAPADVVAALRGE